jgi:hypothetical protein
MYESFNAILECELLAKHRFKKQRVAALAVLDFIEGFLQSTSEAHVDKGFLGHRIRAVNESGHRRSNQTLTRSACRCFSDLFHMLGPTKCSWRRSKCRLHHLNLLPRKSLKLHQFKNINAVHEARGSVFALDIPVIRSPPCSLTCQGVCRTGATYKRIDFRHTSVYFGKTLACCIISRSNVILYLAKKLFADLR